MISREVFFTNDRPGNFYMIGSMGLLSSFGLGLALQFPEKKVYILEGDGSALMSLGTLPLIATESPKNLFHVILDNEAYESTGSQPSISSKVDLDEIAKKTQVSLADIAEAARLYGEAETSALVYALDNIQPKLARDCVLSLVNLALITGNVGKPGAGIYPMRPGANEQGAWDVGCVPERLPGYRWVSNAEDRQALETLWDSSIPDMPGLGLTHIIEGAASGRVKAMFLIGDSPNLSNGKLGNGKPGHVRPGNLKTGNLGTGNRK